MAFTVKFYTFHKRDNSTKRVVTSGTATLEAQNVLLKENTSIINPTLIIHDMGDNLTSPYALNICYIAEFARYYFVNDWRYIVGAWECDCQVDVLATYRNEIFAANKYVLRSHKVHNKTVVDTLYPSVAWQPSNYVYRVSGTYPSFTFARTISGGIFVVGIANRDTVNFSAVSYYFMTNSQINDLVYYMMQPAAELWENLSGFTDTIIRSVYGPFDYIKSCKWFPINPPVQANARAITFGNYTSQILGIPISTSVSNWYSEDKTVYLPSDWISFEAKYRCNPYAHIYIVCNPWGTIELNPLDFTDSREIKLSVYVDYISGVALLKIYKVIQNETYFIMQRSAPISVDIALTSSSINIVGTTTGLMGAAAGAVTAFASEGASVVAGVLTAGASAANAVANSVPSMSGSIGQTYGNMVSMDGEIRLIYQSTYFTAENPEELGYPTMENRTLSTLAYHVTNNVVDCSGYVKCADGDVTLSGAMRQEELEVARYLTEGCFLE